LNAIIDFLNNITKPENLTLISILGLGVPVLLMYFLNRIHIPKLVFDEVWKKNAYYGIDYFIKVKSDKGEGKAEGVIGFVGIKDKLEVKPTLWIGRDIETDILTHNYLSLFKIFEHEGHKIITFPNANDIPSPPDSNLFENCRYTKFKDDKLIVEINATRGRIK
jgi:hypothetical protein